MEFHAKGRLERPCSTADARFFNTRSCRMSDGVNPKDIKPDRVTPVALVNEIGFFTTCGGLAFLKLCPAPAKLSV
jgi:hypothetical protein